MGGSKPHKKCMLGQCWPYPFIIGLALCQHWANLLCLLGIDQLNFGFVMDQCVIILVNTVPTVTWCTL